MCVCLLQRLRASLLVEVRSLLGPGGDGELGDEELLACIRRIVRSEQVSAKARSVYAAAEAELLAHGAEGVLPGIVSHFGKLFDVKRLEGMFPRINVRPASVCVCSVCTCAAAASVCGPAGVVPVRQRDAEFHDRAQGLAGAGLVACALYCVCVVSCAPCCSMLDPHVSTNTVLASVRESLSRSRGGTRRHTRLTPSVSSDDDDGVPVVVLGKARRQGEPPMYVAPSLRVHICIVLIVSACFPPRAVSSRCLPSAQAAA